MSFLNYLKDVRTQGDFQQNLRLELDNIFQDSNIEVIVGDILHETLTFNRELNFFNLEAFLVASLIYQSVQRKNYVEGLTLNTLKQSPKYLVSVVDKDFTSFNKKPFTFRKIFKLDKYFVYVSFDAGDGDLKTSDKTKVSGVFFNEINYSLLLNANSFEDFYFYKGKYFPEGLYTKADTGKVNLTLLNTQVNFKSWGIKYFIDDLEANTTLDYPFIKISEKLNPVKTDKLRDFKYSFSNDLKGTYKTYNLPEDTTQVNLANLPDVFKEASFQDEFIEKVSFPQGEGYPLLEISLDTTENILQFQKSLYGLFLSPFEASNISTFSMLVVQNSGRSFIRYFSTFEGFDVLRQSPSKWVGNITTFKDFKTTSETEELSINLNGVGNTFEGRAYFKTSQIIQVINSTSEIPLNQNSKLVKYETRKALSDAEVLSTYGVSPQSKPKIYFFSPAYVDSKEQPFHLNMFFEANNLTTIQGYSSVQTNVKPLILKTFTLDFDTGSISETVSGVLNTYAVNTYNGYRDGFIEGARVYEDKLELLCNIKNVDVLACGLISSDTESYKEIYTEKRFERTSSGFTITVDQDIFEPQGKKLGWVVYA